MEFLELVISVAAGVGACWLLRRRGMGARGRRWGGVGVALVVLIALAAVMTPASMPPAEMAHATPAPAPAETAEQTAAPAHAGSAPAPMMYREVNADSRKAAREFIAEVDDWLAKGMDAASEHRTHDMLVTTRRFKALRGQAQHQFGTLGSAFRACTVATAEAQRAWSLAATGRGRGMQAAQRFDDAIDDYHEDRASCLAVGSKG
jgi:Na+-transporting methylmalonyl-CoA/oxaloacetate decarboxylase gamma subunit